jgi:hypothetical protein
MNLNPDCWSAVSAISNAITAMGVFFVLPQLILTKRIAQLQFEDGLAKEYRELIAGIPSKAFWGATYRERIQFGAR